MKLWAAGAAIVDVKLAHDSPAIGCPLRELNIPQDANISLIVRGSTGVVPHGDTVMRTGDDVIAVTSLKSEETLRGILIGTGTGG